MPFVDQPWWLPVRSGGEMLWEFDVHDQKHNQIWEMIFTQFWASQIRISSRRDGQKSSPFFYFTIFWHHFWRGKFDVSPKFNSGAVVKLDTDDSIPFLTVWSLCVTFKSDAALTRAHTKWITSPFQILCLFRKLFLLISYQFWLEKK